MPARRTSPRRSKRRSRSPRRSSGKRRRTTRRRSPKRRTYAGTDTRLYGSTPVKSWKVLENKKLRASTCKLRALATNQPHKIGEDQFGLIDHIMTNLDGRMLTEFECPNDGNVITNYTRLLPNYTNYTPDEHIEFTDIQNEQSTSDHIPLVAIVNGPVGFPVLVMQMNLLANLLLGDGFLKGSLPPEKSETVKNALVEFKKELKREYPTTTDMKTLGKDTETWTQVKKRIFTKLNLDEIRNTIEEHSLTETDDDVNKFNQRANVLIPSILRIQPDIIAFQENDMEPHFHDHKMFSKMYTNSYAHEHAHLEKIKSNGKRINEYRRDALGSNFVGDGVSIYVKKERFQIVSVYKLFTSEESPILHVQVKDVDDAVYDVITTHLSSGDNETDKGKRTNDLKDLEMYIQSLGEERNMILMMDANEDVRTRGFMNPLSV